MRPPVVDHITCHNPEYVEGLTLIERMLASDEDKARQEFKNECDVNWLLRKYGALPPGRPFTQGEVDFDLSLLDAKLAVADARTAYEAFPRVLREQLSFDGFLAAVANGSFKMSVLKSDDGSAGSSGEPAADSPTGGRQ